MIAIFDEDGGGDVDFQEFVSGLSAFSSKGNKEEKLHFAFKVYDIDRDGYISNGELFIVLKMMVGNNLKDMQLQQIVDKTIMEADKDGDGKISFEEFTSMVEHTDVSLSMTLGECTAASEGTQTRTSANTPIQISSKSLLSSFHIQSLPSVNREWIFPCDKPLGPSIESCYLWAARRHGTSCQAHWISGAQVLQIRTVYDFEHQNEELMVWGELCKAKPMTKYAIMTGQFLDIVRDCVT